VFWSPQVADTVPDVDGLYLGGGYPELHARELSENERVRKAVRAFAEAGKPIYAECGGLMYLAETLEDPEGVAHPMVGVLPAAVRMRPRKLSLGYTEVSFTSDTPLGPVGTTARGHEFHYSTLDPVPDFVSRTWRVEKRRGGARAEGYVIGRTLMSYVHLHFASCPEIPRRFVDACTQTQ
jgi:cobyrinic acid a,c-diamide synthase